MGGIAGAQGEVLGSVRVLLVEDESASGMVVEQHLAAIRSVQCRTQIATTLEEALERLSRERYDLVIADLHLPDSPAAETIATLVRACDYPVIALTVDESAELRARSVASGAYDYLLKGQLAAGSLERPAPGGGSRWLSISGEPVFDAEGQFKGYRGIGRDITEQKRAEQRLRLEHAVTRVLAEAESVSSALQGVLRAICEAEGWDCGRYFGLDAHAGVMRMQESWSVGTPEVERFVADSRHLALTPGAGLVGITWASGEPLWVPDTQNDARALLAPKGWSRGSFLCPVISDGHTIGIIALTSRNAREPDERLLRAMGVIARQIGQFVQRKQAEAVMRDSEERFRSLTELSSDWYWEQDAEFRFTQLTGPGAQLLANGVVSNYLGKTRRCTPDLELVAGDWSAHRAMLERHEPFQDLVLCRRMADGSRRYMTISGEPMYDGAGGFKGYRGVAKNVTEKVRSEQALRESEARFRSLVELSSDFYWETDAEHRITRTTH